MEQLFLVFLLSDFMWIDIDKINPLRQIHLKNELDIILRRKRGKHLKLKIRDGQITKEVVFG